MSVKLFTVHCLLILGLFFKYIVHYAKVSDTDHEVHNQPDRKLSNNILNESQIVTAGLYSLHFFVRRYLRFFLCFIIVLHIFPNCLSFCLFSRYDISLKTDSLFIFI